MRLLPISGSGLRRCLQWIALGALLASPSGPRAQSPPTQPIDIAVRVFPVAGGLAPDLLDRDFHLPAVHGRHAVVVRRFQWRDDAPTYALLDMAHCGNIPHPYTAAMTAALDRMFQLAWHVSVLDNAHHQTPFADSSAQLATAELVPFRSEPAAVQSLEANAGRHVVFALCVRAVELPASTIQAANAAVAPLFTMRAGAPVLSAAHALPDNFSNSSLSQTGTPSAYLSSFGGLVRDRYFPLFGPLDQPSLGDAVETARQIGGQFFLLHIPRAPLTPEIVLDVRLPGGPGVQYKVTAQSYSAGSFAPRVILAGK